MSDDLRSELRRLYADASKHSVYQSIPDFVAAELDYFEAIDEGWRSDRPRLAYLLDHRRPEAGEHWADFGANTGFFTLSLARQYSRTLFTAIEANPRHVRFIRLIVAHFDLENVRLVEGSIGLEGLPQLPKCDFLLHLNVLHHAGCDFDGELVPSPVEFGSYASRYLERLRAVSGEIYFQMGSNWGGDKALPLVGARDDEGKLKLFSRWLRLGGWVIDRIAYPSCSGQTGIVYRDFSPGDSPDALGEELRKLDLDQFPGEFYRRPMFLGHRTGFAAPVA
ncbi:MAG TPA: hypothetical protein VFX38_07225 [Gammaproteobacteria bacterium]|nr:hypothetical protein [Gammaproteobacteria bacterium]